MNITLNSPLKKSLQFTQAAMPNKKTNKIDFLGGIAHNDPTILEIIYQKYLPMIVDFVRKNSGTELEARDIFQDGLIVIYQKIKKGGFQLTSSFSTYLFSVCRFIWLRELKKKCRQETSLEELPETAVFPDFENEWLENQKQSLFQSKLSSLSADSQKVLNMFFNKKSLNEIAEAMGYTQAYAKRKKFKAKEQLVALIKQDQMYQALI